jgi:hypothetical protein
MGYLRFVQVSLPTTINARLNTIQDACYARSTSSRTDMRFPNLFVPSRGQVAFDLIAPVR